MTLGNECKVVKNENMLRCIEVQRANMSKKATQLRQQNRKIKGRKILNTTVIELHTPVEFDFEADYMGECKCGCHKSLFKGMSVVNIGDEVIYIGCLDKYLKRNLVVL